MIPPVASPPVVVQKKSGLGCWGCGCIVLAVIVLLFCLLVGGLGYAVYSMGRTMTSATPITLTAFDGGDTMYQGVEKKIADFQTARTQHQPASLHLNADEINTLIARDPAYAPLKGHAFVTLQNDQARVQISLPLGQFQHWVYTDRYANDDASFTLHVNPDNKELIFNFSQFQVGDKSLTAEQCQQLNAYVDPLNQKLKQNPDFATFINQATKLTIENSELVIETQ